MGAEQTRPWWASDDPDVHALADEDPIAAYRSARWPSAVGDEGPDPVVGYRSARWPSPAEGEQPDGATPQGPVGGPSSVGHEGPDPVHDPAVCGLCPVCIGLRLVGDYRPDVLEHLNEASRHLSAALRALVSPRPGSPGFADDPADPSVTRFERIDVDGPEESRPVERIDVDGPEDPRPGSSGRGSSARPQDRGREERQA